MDATCRPEDADADVRAVLAEMYGMKDGERPRVAFAATGGGSVLASWLLGTPGASGTVVEVVFPYHRAALEAFLGRELVNVDGGRPVSYSSAGMAHAMARRARASALAAVAADGGVAAATELSIVGVGLTGALSTNRERRGADRCFVAVCCSDGHEELHSAVFTKGDRAAQDRASSRLVIDALVGRFMPAAAAREAARAPAPSAPLFLEQSRVVSATAPADVLAALNPLMGDESVGAHAWFWPRAASSGEQRLVQGLCTDSLRSRARFLVLPGSFNPLHEGHERMARAALLKAKSMDTGPLAHEFVPVFELSISNVDKGEVDLAQVAERVAQFASPGTAGFGPWPVVVTRASRFIDKARLLPGASFVVGFDTAERLVDPKYYGDSNEKTAAALAELAALGSHFFVAGRVKDGEFQAFSRMADRVPAGLRGMFTPLSEAEFRVDLSSTELRAAKRARAAPPASSGA